MVKLIRRIFALLIAAAYFGAAALAAASPIGSCPELKDASPAAHHHHGGKHHQPHDKSGKTAGECLKCCVGACLVVAPLPTPNAGFGPAFEGTPVLYWAGTPAISGRALTPDPGPPRPIA